MFLQSAGTDPLPETEPPARHTVAGRDKPLARSKQATEKLLEKSERRLVSFVDLPSLPNQRHTDDLQRPQPARELRPFLFARKSGGMKWS
jgi:hypothetical protein